MKNTTMVIVNSEGHNTLVTVSAEGHLFYYTLNDGELLVPFEGFLNKTKPKWDGSKWIEAATSEELFEVEAEKIAKDLLPSTEEIEQANFEIRTLNLLIEMGVL